MIIVQYKEVYFIFFIHMYHRPIVEWLTNTGWTGTIQIIPGRLRGLMVKLRQPTLTGILVNRMTFMESALKMYCIIYWIWRSVGWYSMHGVETGCLWKECLVSNLLPSCEKTLFWDCIWISLPLRMYITIKY